MFETIVVGTIAGQRLGIVQQCIARRTAITCVLLAVGLLAPCPALAKDLKCASQPAMAGMPERIASLREQLDVIERTADRAEQRRLMDLHAKLMREGMREIRNRDLAPPCRMDMMGSMMDVMIRHQQAMQDGL